MNVERAALSAAHAYESDNMSKSEYVQKTMEYTVHLYDDHFFVVDPWGQRSSDKPLSELHKTEQGFKNLQFDYEYQDHRRSGLSTPEE